MNIKFTKMMKLHENKKSIEAITIPAKSLMIVIITLTIFITTENY